MVWTWGDRSVEQHSKNWRRVYIRRYQASEAPEGLMALNRMLETDIKPEEGTF